MSLLILIKRKISHIFIVEIIYIFVVTWRREGFVSSIMSLQRSIRTQRMNIVRPIDYKILNGIFQQNANKPIIVFHPFIDWHIPLYQRPQHVALNLAKNDFLYFFCTGNLHYDTIQGFESIADNIYLTNRYKMLEKLDKKKIIHLCSTDNRTDVELVENEINKGNIILYEYIDEIHGSLGGIEIPERTFIKHERILKDERCVVIATADKLYREVLQHRSKNCALVTNGVEFNHFSQKFTREEAPEIIHPLLERNKPIVGYFGALASWFDYELVVKLVQERPDYQILLIGWDYDKSMKGYGLDKFPSITVCGPIQYQDLPRYGCWFDVATIPFRINEVTESTSPIKLFEYMAMGKAIVTTGMPECRKYQSVLIGENHDDFISKIDAALALRGDEAYQHLLEKEALENTWEAKAKVIADLVNANLV